MFVDRSPKWTGAWASHIPGGRNSPHFMTVKTLCEIEDEDRRLDMLIKHLRAQKLNYYGVENTVEPLIKQMVRWIELHQEEENAWGKSFEARNAAIYGKRRLQE